MWIEAASGGESLLANTLLATLATELPPGTRLKVLATATTPQGVDTLEKGKRQRGDDGPIATEVRYFPFDAPSLMQRAFDQIRPRLAVLLETELWPSFLYQARARHIPVLLVNGRMSANSFRHYHRFRALLRQLAPRKILAISDEDAERFGRVMGSEVVAQMNNIKFDRINPRQPGSPAPELAEKLAPQAPFVLLGSIRKEEEEQILSVVSELLAARRDLVIGLFPKHIERAPAWLELLAKHNIPAVRRSDSQTEWPVGGVVVWDVFGELAAAYGLARAAFIGGSLVDLGGQNFLEPLVFGLRPLIGRYWSNFAWVSREIIETGLVSEVADSDALCRQLLARLEADELRETVIDQVRRFLAPRQGGSRQACREILQLLHLQNKNAT